MAVIVKGNNILKYDFDADGADPVAIFVISKPGPGGQVDLQGITFATAGVTLSVCGRFGITGSGPNGAISDADASGFAIWDAVDLAGITGHSAVLDEDAQYQMIKVEGLAAGSKVTVF